MIKDGHPEVVVQELFGYFRVFSILLVDFETKPEEKTEYMYLIKKIQNYLNTWFTKFKSYCKSFSHVDIRIMRLTKKIINSEVNFIGRRVQTNFSLSAVWDMATGLKVIV